jgi:probable HAF family extracellular repeat protein
MQARATKLLKAMVVFLSTGSCAGAVAAVAHAADSRSNALPGYAVTDLGTLGGTLSFATGINDRGWVDGFSNLKGDVEQHAFLWRRGVMTDLGTLGGPNSGVGFWGQAPNDHGAIAGTGESSTIDPNNEQFCASFNSFFSAPATQYECRPFLWRDGAITALPTFGGNNGTANQINDRGQVVGAAETTALDPTCATPTLTRLPALWENGVIHKLPVMPGDDSAVANAINESGQAVGISVGTCTGSPAHAVLWEHGKVTGLGSLGGTAFDEATSINNQGQVVGFSSLPGNTYYHAFSWDRRSGMRDLGTLPGDFNSVAVRINAKGQIVGFSCDVTGIICRAVVWEDGAITDLNTLTRGSHLLLQYAFGINARGEIVGGAQTSNGETHAFLATPDNRDLARASAARATRRAISQRHHVGLPESVRKLLRQRLRFGRRAPLPWPY